MFKTCLCTAVLWTVFAAIYIACTSHPVYSEPVTICIVDSTNGLIDSTYLHNNALKAWQHQIDNEFQYYWNAGANLQICQGNHTELNENIWHLYITEEWFSMNVMGFHEVDTNGIPVGYVHTDVYDTIQKGWTHTTSHELMEMLVNPYINRYCLRKKDKVTRIYFLEVADPVAPREYGYKIDGVLVSNFITPAWYMDSIQLMGKKEPILYDMMGYLKRAYQFVPFGYIHSKFVIEY